MTLTKHQKFMFFALSVFTITSVVLGFNQLYGSLYGSLQTGDEVTSIAQASREEQLRAVNQMLALTYTDSDSDGLSDYDEFYTYKTSSYLKDTDGDGIDDKQELERGDDPTCHKDKQCGEGQVKLIAPPVYQGEEFPFSPVSGVPFESLDASSMKVEDLRALLEQSGFPVDQLSRLTDEELMETWSKVFGDEE